MAGLVSIVLIVLRSTGRRGPKYIAYGTYLCLGTLLFLATRTY
jgi:leader peptidase (prepilin peptidase)/N-methyltransferase